MSAPTIEQVKQALNHLVSVEVSTHDGSGDPMEFTIVGMLRDVTDFASMDHYSGATQYQIGVTSGFRPGAYDDFSMDVQIGSPEGLLISDSEIVSFTDQGERSDFEVGLAQLVMQREHALRALKDAEKNLQAAYATITNLTAQEG